MSELTKKHVDAYEAYLKALVRWHVDRLRWRKRWLWVAALAIGWTLSTTALLFSASDYLGQFGWFKHYSLKEFWGLLQMVPGVGVFLLATRIEARLKRRMLPRAAVQLYLPFCYACKFDLSPLLSDHPDARVTCPECGQRQKRSRAPEGFQPHTIRASLVRAVQMDKLRKEAARRLQRAATPTTALPPGPRARILSARSRGRAFALFGVAPRRAHARWASMNIGSGHGESEVLAIARLSGIWICIPLAVMYGLLGLAGENLLTSASLQIIIVNIFLALLTLFGLVAYVRRVRTLLRHSPRAYALLALPTCYRCGFDLAGILTDEPRARVVCPECGQRQLRCRIPQDRPVVWKAAPKSPPSGVVMRFNRDEPVQEQRA